MLKHRWRAVVLAFLVVAEFSVGAEERVLEQYCAHASGHAGSAVVGAVRQYAPSRTVDIVHQVLDVTPDFERRSLSGTIQMEFKPVAWSLDELKLDAVNLTIVAVTASAAVQNWQNTGEQLIVTFREPVAAGASAWLRVVYSVEQPVQGLYFRTPAMGYREGDTHLWTQGEMHEARHWFPCYDFPNEKFTTEMICRVPEGMVALSNGRLISQEKDAASGRVAWRWLQDKPHVNYLVTLCAGYFKKLEDRFGDLPLAFWAPASRIADAANSFAGTKDMVAFMEQETRVKYPWARYDQVVVDDFTWGGMENTAQTTLYGGTLYPDSLRETRSSLGLIIHELAHQWFGDLVTTKDWAHVWLNEGFATYYEALYRESAFGRDEFLWSVLGNARAVLGQANDVVPIVHRGFRDPAEQFGFRAYPKGSWILHMLRSQLGPALYRDCIHAYLERHAYGVVTTEDLVAVIEEKSGRDWDQFFDQYVYHAHHPELSVSYAWDERTKLAKISVAQTQKLGPTVLLFRLPLTIRFKSTQTVTDRVAHLTQAQEDFYFPLPEKPDVVRVDPETAWLADVVFPLSDDMLRAQLSDGSDMIGRVRAVEQLAKKDDTLTIERLQSVLRHDGFWGVRLEAAKALRQIHNEAARAALLASTHQPDARVRREVNRAIASFFRPETPAVMAGLLEQETNPDLVADGLRALAAYPVSEVRDLLIARLHSSSYEQVLAEAAIEAMRQQGDPTFVDPLLAALRQREAELTSRGFAAGLETLALLAVNLENKSPVREFLVGHVNHAKREVQSAAIRALGTLGDRLALPVLQTFVQARKESPQRKAAEASVQQIRDRQPQSIEVGSLRQEVLDLQKSNRELKQALEDLKKQVEATKPASATSGAVPVGK